MACLHTLIPEFQSSDGWFRGGGQRGTQRTDQKTIPCEPSIQELHSQWVIIERLSGRLVSDTSDLWRKICCCRTVAKKARLRKHRRITTKVNNRQDISTQTTLITETSDATKELIPCEIHANYDITAVAASLSSVCTPQWVPQPFSNGW